MGKFPTYPGTIDVKSVVHCSSEDTDYPGSNIVNKPGKAWRCSRKEAGTGRASITLELDTPTFIQSIEIVNAGSAFVQIDGLVREETSPVPLLPMRMIMSEQDCNSSSVSAVYTSTHVFKRKDFADDSFRRFKFLAVTVMQPFKLGYPFGIGKLVVEKPCYADKIQTQTPGLSDPNKGQEIEFSFMKRSPKKQPAPLNERIWGLNDAVNDENFEMKKSAPMNRLGMKSKEKVNIPKRNSYFANLNEQHGFVYKTPRTKKKSNSSKTPTTAEKTESGIDEDKENASVDNSKSFYGDQETTPSRKRKKSKLNIAESTGSKSGKKRSLDKKAHDSDDNDDLPEISFTNASDEEMDTSVSRPSISTKSPSRPSTSTKSPSRTPSSSSASRSPVIPAKSPSRSPTFLSGASVTPGRCNFTKSPDRSKLDPEITVVSPGKNVMRTPKRINTQPSWISSSFGEKNSRKSPISGRRSDSSTGKSRKTSDSKSRKIPTKKSPAGSRKSDETPSTKRWNSTVTGRSPKFITIPDIDDSRKSPRRERKSSDDSGVIIIDERCPGKRTPGRARKYSSDKTIRISVTNSKPGASRRADDDDVLICNPLPVTKNTSASRRDKVDGFGDVSEVELVSCPMCGDSFLPNVIETHANNCLDSFNKFS